MIKSLLLSLAAASLCIACASPAAAYPPRDRDNNPPGPRGGAGTNWENPPGARGGPGASPDRPVHRAIVGGRVHVWSPARGCWTPDRDNNPPGLTGGRGTNWENPPGPVGGPGASPDRNICR